MGDALVKSLEQKFHTSRVIQYAFRVFSSYRWGQFESLGKIVVINIVLYPQLSSLKNSYTLGMGTFIGTYARRISILKSLDRKIISKLILYDL